MLRMVRHPRRLAEKNVANFLMVRFSPVVILSVSVCCIPVSDDTVEGGCFSIQLNSREYILKASQGIKDEGSVGEFSANVHSHD